MEKCRLCYTNPDPEMCQHIFNTKFEPPIWKIIEQLSNLVITKGDPYTKNLCSPCFNNLVKYSDFRRQILDTDYLIQHEKEQLSEKTNDDCDYLEVHCTPTISDSGDFLIKEEEIKIEEVPLKIEFSCTSPEIREIADNAGSNVLPDKSKDLYERRYLKFEEWCCENKIVNVSENVLLAYFNLLKQEYKPTTLWSTYSMLKSCLYIKKNVDISKYKKLLALLKRSSDGYKPKKTKILEEEDIHKFLKDADDKTYLAMKVILIMGYNGCCRREELTNMSLDDVDFKSDCIVVTIPKTRNIILRTFVIIDPQWIALIKKYVNLRPKKVTSKRFFLTYRQGHCVNLPIGINLIGKVSKNIATFLQLPEPELFTGHCLRRSGATHLVNHGGDLLSLKRFGGWKLNLPSCSRYTGVTANSSDTSTATVNVYNNCTFNENKLNQNYGNSF